MNVMTLHMIWVREFRNVNANCCLLRVNFQDVRDGYDLLILHNW